MSHGYCFADNLPARSLRHEQREDVVAGGAVRVTAAGGNLLVEEGVGALALCGEAPPRAQGPVPARRQRHRQHPRPARDHVEQAPQRPSDPLAALGVVEAEDGPHDHLEGDRLHARERGELAICRPCGDSPFGHLFHHRPVGAHPLTVKRR